MAHDRDPINAIFLESRVRQIVRRALEGQPIEDDLSECKSEPPEPSQAARRLAACANSARGEKFLWILGIDEKQRKISPVTSLELADWIPQVKKCFDGPSPALIANRNVTVNEAGELVTALMFDSAESPYVVICNQHVADRQALVLDFPWRDGTRVRSARRMDLIDLLAQRVRLPTIEIRSAHASIQATNPQISSFGVLHLDVVLYLMPATNGEPLIIPKHRCHLHWSHPEDRAPAAFPAALSSPSHEHHRMDSAFGKVVPQPYSMVQETAEQLVFSGPANAQIRGSRLLHRGGCGPSGPFDVLLTMEALGASLPIQLVFHFSPRQATPMELQSRISEAWIIRNETEKE